MDNFHNDYNGTLAVVKNLKAVKYENTRVWTMEDSTGKMNLLSRLSVFGTTVKADKVYDVTGIVGNYYEAGLLGRSKVAPDLVEVTAP